MKLSRFTKGAVAVATAVALSTTAVTPATADAADAAAAGSLASTYYGSVGGYSIVASVIGLALSILFWTVMYNLAVKGGVLKGETVKLPFAPVLPQ